ncbi:MULTISPECIES: dimethylamine monooxygenase subunit DmmA family protein [unclassified Pseudonocardia]|uniref:dimethylamine monooxygenase subunit DmmA family protein n=1 Tax=unclassified Pseudonocardia TaxID=2619320 RepID=UPI0001FFE011|nr:MULTISPECIES: dimethylamine monooxygenase subunit DmmA family protein [unclassified Pseudonocardia]OLM18815.1 hypothetical protein Ae707Ps1_3074 [Pseudonocardia sp. Ae707_Ps1]
MPAPVPPSRTGAAPRSPHVPSEQTSQPRYAARARGPAPHLVVTVGGAAAPEVRPQDRLVEIAPGAATGDRLGIELAGVTTGWRILVTGPELEVQEVRSAALARGALDEELLLVPTDVTGTGDAAVEGVRRRAVHCGHCHVRFVSETAPGDALGCPGCRSELVVAHHHSRTHAAFLGVPTGTRVGGPGA